MKALIERKNNSVVWVYPAKGGGFTANKLKRKRKLKQYDISRLREWCKNKGYKLRIFEDGEPYPFIILDSDTKMVNEALAKKINRLGRVMRRYIWMGEGLRTYARQKELWDQYVARNYAPPITARPGTSNHETGNAADISLFMYGTDQGYVNVGKVRRARVLMKRYGLSLPVPGEPWHTEIGSVWRA